MPTNGVQTVDKIACLRSTGLFGNLSDGVLKNIAAHAVARRLEAGQILCSEYDEASGLYVVARGQLRSVRQDSEGREQVLSTEHAGAILAMVPVFNGGNFYSTIIADIPSEVLCIDTRDMHEFCREHTEVFWSVAKALAHKVRHYAELIETLALRNVNQRVAQHILSTCQERGVYGDRSCVIELTMSQAELASRVGSTREVVCRAFGQLQQRGLIQMKGLRLLTVPDMQALSRFAGKEHQLDKPRLVSDLSSEMA